MFEAPYPPYSPQDKQSFSYDTVARRWPIIITNIIDHVHRLVHDMAMEAQAQASDGNDDRVRNIQLRIEEGKEIIAKASRLKYRMARDQELEKIPQDGEMYVDEYNAELEELAKAKKNTWFTAPRLFLGCYLYRLFRSFFNQTTCWVNFDPFFVQKEEMFKNSAAAIHQIATTMHELEREKHILIEDPDKLFVLFKEMVQMCLWGNATDLAFLTDLTPSDIENLQTVGRDAQQARKELILRDDQEAVWNHVQTMKLQEGTVARCDFVLDNAGFELFTDLVFADFLVTCTPYFSKVAFHPKHFPWFVSDVTPTDFYKTIDSLLSPTFFLADSAVTSESVQHLKHLVERWQRYLKEGIFCLSTELEDGHKKTQFWTGPWPYWCMEEKANELHQWLAGSSLVIFKGDLNYRKYVLFVWKSSIRDRGCTD
ncbi:hypothetical protein SCLCIDRAFT_1216160 [Scleroderma citrinum Foug A]|uniref:Sugar phosphate phosphatase n=1 Tax=Scleroderma citrinum Foug A TaxID=1036808 RepID=A0A0C3DKP0_9AGAM|nr:hypothetical protein SCLCIDRAFT_1216160 [Scleroderma citrinum Foug A]